ncbi:MAG: DUF1287 domain-containing protein [Planctomycetota bacterium]
MQKRLRFLIIGFILIGLSLFILGVTGYFADNKTTFLERWRPEYVPTGQEPGERQTKTKAEKFPDKLVSAAIEQTKHQVVYDPAYVKISYPGGDVPENRGVCTDVIIRAYRKVGIDLQKEIHEEMAQNFHLYPRIWGLAQPDSNIDHRRVANLMVFFKRKGETLSISNQAAGYLAGNIVTWDLGKGVTHIGLLTDQKSDDAKRFKVVHNIGSGPKLEDVLFSWEITGHFRYSKSGD